MNHCCSKGAANSNGLDTVCNPFINFPTTYTNKLTACGRLMICLLFLLKLLIFFSFPILYLILSVFVLCVESSFTHSRYFFSLVMFGLQHHNLYIHIGQTIGCDRLQTVFFLFSILFIHSSILMQRKDEVLCASFFLLALCVFVHICLWYKCDCDFFSLFSKKKNVK